MSARLLDRAERALRVASLRLEHGGTAHAAGRARSAMGWVAVALLSERAGAVRPDQAISVSVEQHLFRPGLLDARFQPWLDEALRRPPGAARRADAPLTAEEALALVDRARDLLRAGRNLLG